MPPSDGSVALPDSRAPHPERPAFPSTAGRQVEISSAGGPTTRSSSSTSSTSATSASTAAGPRSCGASCSCSGRPSRCCPMIAMLDLVVLVEQFRTGCIDLPGEPWLIEAVAGLVEEGEAPEEVAARETARGDRARGRSSGIRVPLPCQPRRHLRARAGLCRRGGGPGMRAACSAWRTRARISAPMSCRR